MGAASLDSKTLRRHANLPRPQPAPLYYPHNLDPQVGPTHRTAVVLRGTQSAFMDPPPPSSQHHCRMWPPCVRPPPSGRG